jgi:hypothetical protein
MLQRMWTLYLLSQPVLSQMNVTVIALLNNFN